MVSRLREAVAGGPVAAGRGRCTGAVFGWRSGSSCMTSGRERRASDADDADPERLGDRQAERLVNACVDLGHERLRAPAGAAAIAWSMSPCRSSADAGQVVQRRCSIAGLGEAA